MNLKDAQRSHRETAMRMRRLMDATPLEEMTLAELHDLACQANALRRITETVAHHVGNRDRDQMLYGTLERIARIGGRVDVTV